MSDREEEARPAQRSKGGASPARYLYGALLVAIGGCLGIVIGSVSDTPRILFERMRGPVETVDLEPPQPASAAAPAAPAPLEAFGELQGAPAPKPKPAPKAAEPAKVAEAAKPKPPAPAVSSPPPAAGAAPASAKSPDEIVRELEKKTAAPAPAATANTVVQVLSLADQKQADAMIAKLRAQGFQPYASPMPNKAGKLRVRVRPKAGETTAALEARLRELGFKTWTTAE
jgi:sporulation related protein